MTSGKTVTGFHTATGSVTLIPSHVSYWLYSLKVISTHLGKNQNQASNHGNPRSLKDWCKIRAEGYQPSNLEVRLYIKNLVLLTAEKWKMEKNEVEKKKTKKQFSKFTNPLPYINLHITEYMCKHYSITEKHPLISFLQEKTDKSVQNDTTYLNLTLWTAGGS